MKRVKKLLCLVLALAMTAMLFACGAKTEGDTTRTDTETPNADAVVIKIGAQCMPGSDEDLCLTKFVELVNSRSGGSIDMQCFGASQLGSLSDLMEGVSLGTVEMCEIGVAVYMAIVPSFEIYDTWMYDGPQTFRALFESEASQKVQQQLIDEAGIRLLAYNAAGGGRFDTWTKEPVSSIAELKGLNIRIPAVASMASIYNGLGANAVNMSFADTYTGAQTGVIYGCCLDAANMINGNLTEQFKYQLVGMPNFQPMCLAVNEQVWQSLTAEQQEIISAAAREAIQDYGDELYAATQASLQDDLAAAGITTATMSDADISAMTELADKVLKEALAPYFTEDELSEIFALCGK